MKLALKRQLPAGPIAIALALVAGAGMVAGREKPALELVESVSPARKALPGELDLAKLKRADAAPPQGDPFAPRSFAPAPASAPAAGKKAPEAPPLPFVYVGRITQDGKTEVFVLRGDELIAIAPGSTIDREYRVEAISQSRIVFTYLPLKARQSLELEEGSG